VPFRSATSPMPDNRPADDRFRRMQFAHRIADTIADRPTRRASWLACTASGRRQTTVLNFIEDRLDENEDVVCVRFNPALSSDSQLCCRSSRLLLPLLNRLGLHVETVGKWLAPRTPRTVSVGIGSSTLRRFGIQSLGESLSSVDVQEKRKS